MNRVELLNLIATNHNVTKAEAGRILATILEAITTSVKKGKPVTLVGFGTFKQVARAARTAYSPATREKVKVPATKIPKFVPGLSFKRAVDPKLAARLDAKKSK